MQSIQMTPCCNRLSLLLAAVQAIAAVRPAIAANEKSGTWLAGGTAAQHNARMAWFRLAKFGIAPITARSFRLSVLKAYDPPRIRKIELLPPL